MSDDKSENQEKDSDSESKVVIAQATKNAQGLIQTTIIPSVKTLIKFTPVGGRLSVFILSFATAMVFSFSYFSHHSINRFCGVCLILV